MAERYADLDPRDKSTQALLLADHLPKGRLWSKAYDADSNIGALVRALAVELYALEQFQRNVADEWTIGTTVAWLTDWEASVGLPNRCLELPTDIDERRALVRAMLTNFGGVHTNAEYVNAGALLGFTVNIIAGNTEGGFATPLIQSNTIIIEVVGSFGGSPGFPAPFAMAFGTGLPAVVRCFYEAIAPATDQIIVREAP